MTTIKILRSIILALALLTLTSCFNGNNNNERQIVDIHTSENSLDWYGVYKGIIPSADGDGIEVKITLKKDSTYVRVLKYLGKEDNLFFDEGNFEWDNTGSKITLLGENDKQIYLVGEDALFHLDQKGNKIVGDLEPMYRIHKNRADHALEGKKWILVELNGAAVINSSEERIAFIMLNKETGMFSGNNSCNNFFGEYEIAKENRIKLGQAGATLMACPDAKNEQAFMEMLQLVDNYSVTENILTLNKIDMVRVARFELSVGDESNSN